MAGKVRVKEHENITESNVKKVIELLEAEKPISKKDAYSILNISPNPTRLAKIITEYKEEQAERVRRKAANRGKPATPYEIQAIIEGYLDGDSVADLAKRLYRSPSFVKDTVDRIGVPQRVTSSDYTKYGEIPEACASEEFRPGQIVWFAKRHCMAIVREEKTNVRDKTNKYYQVYVIEPVEEASPYYPEYEGYGGYFDGAYAYDLGNLDHLKEYGVDIYRPYKPYFKNWL